MISEADSSRTLKRYPYIRDALLSLGNENHNVRIINISASGLNFEANVLLQLEAEIKLAWNDPTFGTITPTMYVVRRMERPKGEFQYMFGAQFFNLDPLAKEKLVKALRDLRSQENADALQKTNEATPQYLLEVVEHISKYIEGWISGSITPPQIISTILGTIAEHEKKSFRVDGVVNRSFQNLVKNVVQCKIIENLTPAIVNNQDLKSHYYKNVDNLLKIIDETNQGIPKTRVAVNQTFLLDTERNIVMHNLEETVKRAYYAKHDMLQKIFKYLGSDTDNLQYFESFPAITVEYEKMRNTSKPKPLSTVLTKQISIGPNPYVAKRNNLQPSTSIEYIIDDRTPPTYIKKMFILLSLTLALAGIILIIKLVL